MDDLSSYQAYLEQSEKKYEALCKRCGACCGVFEKDPCTKLVRDEDGYYRCSDYANRFGMQKTILGNEFKCVTLRHIRSGLWPGSWQCSYKKNCY